MKILGPQLVAAAIALLSVSLVAQERLPDSYLQKLTTIDRLQKLTSIDLAELTSHAQSGVPEAQYQLALVYGAGRIVPGDEAASQAWMMKAAEQGHVSAETFMGLMYLDNHTTDSVPNYAEAERWLLLAATRGDAEAELWLGIGYDRGHFGRIDYQASSSGSKNLQPKDCQTHNLRSHKCTKTGMGLPGAMRTRPTGTDEPLTISLTLAESFRQRYS